jgi:hypothetical protein
MATMSVYKNGEHALIEEDQLADFKKGGWSTTEQKKATTTAKPKRARNADGTLKGDDKSTPNVNEAWVKE